MLKRIVPPVKRHNIKQLCGINKSLSTAVLFCSNTKKHWTGSEAHWQNAGGTKKGKSIEETRTEIKDKEYTTWKWTYICSAKHVSI